MLHFDGDYLGVDGEIGTASGTSFTSGVYGSGVLLNGSDTLTYPTSGNLNLTEGAVEFWVRPNWASNDGLNHHFFDVGVDGVGGSALRVTKDGGGALRFIVWSPSGEYGIAESATLSSGTWQHIAVTWRQGEIRLYRNGNLRASRQGVPFPSSVSGSIRIGSSSPANAAGANATIDEFRISSIARLGFSDTCGGVLPSTLQDHPGSPSSSATTPTPSGKGLE